MDIFTKEELQHILKIMDNCYLDLCGQKLGRKIQSIIDNYDNHNENNLEFVC